MLGSFAAAISGFLLVNYFNAASKSSSINSVVSPDGPVHLQETNSAAPERVQKDSVKVATDSKLAGPSVHDDTVENETALGEEPTVEVADMPAKPGSDKAAEVVDEEPANEQQEIADSPAGPVIRVAEEGPAIPPPIPAVIEKIGKNAFSNVRKEFRYQTSAKNALILYDAFSKSYLFDEYQQERVDEELAEWKLRADRNLYRLGTEWVAKDLVDRAIEEGNRLVEAGVKALEEGSYSTAVAIFDQASRANPNGIRADYLVGLIYSLPFSGAIGPKTAQEYFARVVSRDPKHGAALNSLAIAQVKQSDYMDAYQSFRNASEVLEKCPEVIHNVGRVISLSNRSRIAPADPILEKFEELHASLISSDKYEAVEENSGWLHMPPVFAQTERKEKNIPEDEEVNLAAASYINVSCGSGFLVHPEYYLTNRHVAVDDDFGVADRVGVQISQPNLPTSERFGSVVAVSPEVDLALLHVPEAEGNPIPVSDVDIPLASEILILGYPIPDQFGDQLKTTQGIVAGLPDRNRKSGGAYYFFDALADHGNSGGPILDRNGNVCSILTVGFNQIDINAKFTGGVPASAAIKFLEKSIRGWNCPKAEIGKRKEWADLVVQYAPSVVKVNVYYQSGVPSVAKAIAEKSRTKNYLEDKTCATCSGRTYLKCNAKGCVNGTISTKTYRGGVVGLGNARKVARVPVFSTVDCKNCNAGEFDCPSCRDGYDYELR